MNKSIIIALVAILIATSIGFVGTMALGSASDSTTREGQPSQGLSDKDIRDGLMNHGADHETGQH